MKTLRFLLITVSISIATLAQDSQKAKPAQPEPPAATQPAQAEDISGMYSFLREGEFVQVTVEEGNTVSGFVSRYGDSDSDKGTFLDQFFTKASLKDRHLTFTTKAIHGVSFEFDGNVERGPGKTPHEEGYRVIRGTLTQITEDSSKKTTSRSRQVEFKSFPQDLDRDSQKKP